MGGPLSWWTLVLAGTLSLLLDTSEAHVALTYPPARKYDLDFLDNSRTKAPCGMPRGGIKTSFLMGSKFNVSWHLGYPHKGGFKIQLLDELERPVLDLTPSIQGSDFISDDATAQSYPVQLPQNYACLNCTLRLLRQAIEWGSNYRFWSCADVDIKPKKEFRETCNGHGRYLLARCKCDRFYYGDRCQFRGECIDDNDCGVQGKCIEIDALVKQCFCQAGWFGPACSKRSYVKNTEIDFDLYKTKNLSETFRLHWRILKEQKEIEVVMVVNGTSYVAVGWRPRSLTSGCKNFPSIVGVPLTTTVAAKDDAKPEPEPKSEPEPTSEPEPEPTVEPKSEPEPTAEPKSEPEPPSKKAEPESGANKIKKSLFARRSTSDQPDEDFQDGVIETSVSYQVSAKHGRRKRAVNPEPDAEPSSEPVPPIKHHESKAEPSSEPSPSPSPSPEPTSEPEPASNPEPTAEPKSEPEPEPKSEPEPQSEPEPPGAKTAKSHPNLESAPNETKGNDQLNPFTPRHDFNPMDCTDIVIGMARDGVSRIDDYYTRDRSTPRADGYWGGKNDLTAALGYEKDGATVILFRKKLTAKEPTDHSIEDDLMHVIWAQGQEIGSYVHVPKSGVETPNAKIKDFYKPDELKYHGHGAQRGATAINFLEDKISEAQVDSTGETQPVVSDCSGEWKLPRNCDPENYTCEYSARWSYLPRKDEMRFTITTSHTDLWTGIAFSDDDRMSQTDAILGWVDVTGRPFIMDTWISGYTQPLLDSVQNIYNTSASVNNGVTTLSFVRKRNTTDPKDLAFTDDHCLFMMYPVKGGAFNMRNKKIRRHESIPIVSTERICIRSCGDDYDDIFDAATTPEPPGIGYIVAIKIVDLGENFHFPKQGTVEYDELSNSIGENFKPLFNKIPGYRKLTIQDLREESNDVIAKMNLQLDKATVEKGRSLEDEAAHDEEVHKIIQDSLLSGTVGALKVDENFLTFEPQGVTSNVISDASEENRSFFSLSETKLYLVLGCIAALVLVAIIQASCTIYRAASKSSSSHKDHLIPNSAWKDYSAAANTNYAFDTLEEEKKQANGKGRSETLPAKNSRGAMRPHPHHQTRPQQNQTGADTRSLQRSRGAGGHPPGNLERSTFSLPRTAYDNRSRPAPQDMQPDFYFMPSQRKYSGEVVRVYVDYNNQPK